MRLMSNPYRLGSKLARPIAKQLMRSAVFLHFSSGLRGRSSAKLNDEAPARHNHGLIKRGVTRVAAATVGESKITDSTRDLRQPAKGPYNKVFGTVG